MKTGSHRTPARSSSLFPLSYPKSKKNHFPLPAEPVFILSYERPCGKTFFPAYANSTTRSGRWFFLEEKKMIRSGSKVSHLRGGILSGPKSRLRWILVARNFFFEPSSWMSHGIKLCYASRPKTIRYVYRENARSGRNSRSFGDYLSRFLYPPCGLSCVARLTYTSTSHSMHSIFPTRATKWRRRTCPSRRRNIYWLFAMGIWQTSKGIKRF